MINKKHLLKSGFSVFHFFYLSKTHISTFHQHNINNYCPQTEMKINPGKIKKLEVCLAQTLLCAQICFLLTFWRPPLQLSRTPEVQWPQAGNHRQSLHCVHSVWLKSNNLTSVFPQLPVTFLSVDFERS